MKKITISIWYIFFAAFLLSGCSGAKSTEPEVKNVIFMIGDGMGLAHVQLAMLSSDAPLALERSEYVGLVKTYSANNRVTDSGAGGTALATGHKTFNGRIGVDSNGLPLRNLIEKSLEAGLSTGVVVTKDITDATPATFLAHSKSRRNTVGIATDITASGVDLFIGGGQKHFDTDENLTEVLRNKGYQVAYTLDEILSVNEGRLGAMLAAGHLPTITEGRGDYLPLATAQALKILKTNSSKNDKGFFVMVEGSMIDTAGHANDAVFVNNETVDFDNAIRVAMDFADNNPGTLVIVTADHETGGLILPSGDDDFLLADQGLRILFGSKSHTAVMVPIYAYGAGASEFTGIMENTDVCRKVEKLLKLK